jgi:uncharacterized protein
MPADSQATSDPAPRQRISWLAPALAALVGFGVGDSLRPPAQQTTVRAAIASIDIYRATLSPAFARSGLVRCRFEPSCSLYAREAIGRYGWPRGFRLAAGRLLRCHPWARGGVDPVP